MKFRVTNVIFGSFVPEPGDDVKSVRELNTENTTSMIYDDGLLYVEAVKGRAIYFEHQIARMVADPNPTTPVKKKSR